MLFNLPLLDLVFNYYIKLRANCEEESTAGLQTQLLITCFKIILALEEHNSSILNCATGKFCTAQPVAAPASLFFFFSLCVRNSLDDRAYVFCTGIGFSCPLLSVLIINKQGFAADPQREDAPCLDHCCCTIPPC